MKAIIVGHGPSMMLEPMGALIDEYDCIIRLKRCQDTLKHPDYYGTRTDVVGGSLTIAGQLRGIGNAPEYWVFVDSRHTDVDPAILERVPKLFPDATCLLDKPLCDAWDAHYRDLRDVMGGHGHNHTSQGFKAILYALKHLQPTSLTLVGFDNICSGAFTWSITRGPDWQHYPDHRWDVEHALIPVIEDTFNLPIGFLLPEEDKTCVS